MAVKRTEPRVRFERQIVRDGVSTCWHWGGSANPHYGSFALVAGHRHTKRVLAHRFAYQLYVGPIPEGLHIDHICRNKLCVNPDHLRPVTRAENMMAIPEEIRTRGRRKDACANGHAYTAETTTIVKGRYGEERICRVCRREYERAHRAKRRAS